MTDLFISYSRIYRDAVINLANTLREFSLNVWLDVDLQVGSVFADAIQAQLSTAKCVLVLWTKDALDKGPGGWVYSEADWARQHNKLVQARLESVTLHPPFFNSQDPPVDLSALTGAPVSARALDAQLPELLRRIGRLVGRPGLKDFLSARGSDESLLKWAARFPRDPIVSSPMLCDARARANAAVEPAARPTRKHSSLATELRALAQATRAAPLKDFSPRFPVALLDETNLTHGARDAVLETTLFDSQALRALIFATARESDGQVLRVAIIAGGRLFAIDARTGAAEAFIANHVPIARLEAILLTNANPSENFELGIFYREICQSSENIVLPVYGPENTQLAVEHFNQESGLDGATCGIQAWGPSPEPGRSVIVFEGDGLVVSAFTTREQAAKGNISYRFDYRGRSVVIGGDGTVTSAHVAANADVILDVGSPRHSICSDRHVAETIEAIVQDTAAGHRGALIAMPTSNSEINIHVL